ncbi:NfeD family protein [Nocardioides pantholopis]|uniref:NfeD family protein n=1 Tax=Nocardioides pantholopis TaxID=2483798 RepID=UPI000F0924F6|nr:hypothetical protein [Nocardioides pantholopis]
MTTFLVIGVLGLVLLTVSLVVGDFLDGVLDGLFDGLGGDVFSTAVIGAFVSAFGFGAAAAEGADLPLGVVLPVGLGAGLVFGWFATWLTGLVRGGGSDGTPSTSDAVGHEGSVTTEIPADGLGTVRILVGGHVIRLNARAELPIPAGTAVHVTGVLSPTAVTVAPVWPEALELDGPDPAP